MILHARVILMNCPDVTYGVDFEHLFEQEENVSPVNSHHAHGHRPVRLRRSSRAVPARLRKKWRDEVAQQSQLLAPKTGLRNSTSLFRSSIDEDNWQLSFLKRENGQQIDKQVYDTMFPSRPANACTHDRVNTQAFAQVMQ